MKVSLSDAARLRSIEGLGACGMERSYWDAYSVRH